MATIEYRNPLEDLFNSLPQVFTTLASIGLQRDQFAHTVQQDTIKNKRADDKAAEERDSAEIALGSGLEGISLDKFLDTISQETSTGLEQWKGEKARAKVEMDRTTRVKNIIGTPIKDITPEKLRTAMTEANPGELGQLQMMVGKLEGVTLQSNTEALLKELGYKDDSNPIRVVRTSPVLVPTALGMMADDFAANRVRPTIQQIGASISILEERVAVEAQKQAEDAKYDDTRLIWMRGKLDILYNKFIQKAGIGKQNGGDRYTVGEIRELEGIKEMYIGGGIWEPADDDLKNYPKLSNLTEDQHSSLIGYIEGHGKLADNASLERLLNDQDFMNAIPSDILNPDDGQEPVTEPDIVEYPSQGFFPEGFDLTRDMPF